MADLVHWLAGLGLQKYAAVFAEQEIDFDLLRLLTEADVRELGLPIGPRRKLLSAIRALRGEGPSDRRNEAERRQLTVMFVDLADSTALSTRLDPEAMREVLRDYQNAVADEVERVGGHLAKLMGDGVLAYFGWPQAHEDDAARAALAGLAAVEAVTHLTGPFGEQLACRVGIATGLVVVGDLIGAAAQEHAVVGATPNLAARLQAAAGPGEVVIAEATLRLLRSGFASEALGHRLLKGHQHPVPLFRLLREQPRESRFAVRVDGSLGPLVGRDEELSALLRNWDSVKAGRGGTVVLVGEAGIGKSRLLRAFADAASCDDPTWRLYQCSPFHTETPLWPIAQPLSFAAKTGGLDDRRTAPLGKMLGALVEELRGVARAKPAIVLFEDVQWADPATIDLLRALMDEIADVPLLLIVTARPEGEARFRAAPHAARLALGRLNPAASAALVEIVCGASPVPERLGETILARSDGVPLFIEEITKAVLEAGSAAEQAAVPATLHDSLIARLDVSPAMKATAQIAACIGRDFDRALLDRVADIPAAELCDGIATLIRSGLVFDKGKSGCSFKHALIRDIAYETMLTPRRHKLHQRIAEALEAAPGDRAAAEPELIARHWFAAGQPARAEPYWLRARHQAVHWQKQFEALAEYLNGAATVDGDTTDGSAARGKLH